MEVSDDTETIETQKALPIGIGSAFILGVAAIGFEPTKIGSLSDCRHIDFMLISLRFQAFPRNTRLNHIVFA
jgi:hypothetical protein